MSRAARLFTVIDTLNAMTSDQPCRKGWSFDAKGERIVVFTTGPENQGG